MARTGRPPVLDAEKKAKVLEVVAAGFPIRYAARYVGCDEGTIRHAGQRDPEFYDQVKYAQFKAEYDLVKNIRTASESGKNWRAAAWSLERMFPDRYGPHHRDEITQEHLVQLSRTYLAIVKRRVPEPLREEVIKEMRRASAEMMISSAVHTVEDNARSGGLPEEFVPPYWYPEDLRTQEECGDEPPAGAPFAAEGVGTNEGAGKEKSGFNRQESFASSAAFASLWCSCVLAVPATGAPQRREGHREGVPLLGRTSMAPTSPPVAEQVPAAPAAAEEVVAPPARGEEVPAFSVAAEQVPAAPAAAEQVGHPEAEGGPRARDRRQECTAPAAAEQVPGPPASAGRSPDVPPRAAEVPASGRSAGALLPAEQVPGATHAAEQVVYAAAEMGKEDAPAPPAEQVQTVETTPAAVQRRRPPDEGVYAHGQAP
jgi:hypothetical protein